MNKQLLCISLIVSIMIGSLAVAKRACKDIDGTLDMTFGNHGLVQTDMGSDADFATSLVILPCGRIVAGGTVLFDSPTGHTEFALAGYTSFGALDPNFGTNGKVFTNLAVELDNAGIVVDILPSNDVLNALALQKDCNGCADLCPAACTLSCTHNCNILAVGSSDALTANSPAVALARYKCDGTLDTTFGMSAPGMTPSGVTVIPVGDLSTATAVAIQEDNKIVVVGTVFFNDEIVNRHFLVMRLNCDGTLDETFGCDNSGIVIISFGGITEVARAVKIQKDGKIVVAGFSNANGSSDFALARLTRDGELDKCFGKKGKVLTDFSGNDTSDDIASALVLTEECASCFDCSETVKIIAVGSTQNENEAANFALAGYTENGCLDRCFGPDHTGLVVTSFGDNVESGAFAAVLQKDCAKKCKIVAAGYAVLREKQVGPDAEFALARYWLNGALDEDTFGFDGTVTTSFGKETTSSAAALARQENGNLIAAGLVEVDGVTDFGLARYDVCTPCCVEVCAAGCAKECGIRTCGKA